jgi:hypothetical protein
MPIDDETQPGDVEAADYRAFRFGFGTNKHPDMRPASLCADSAHAADVVMPPIAPT